MQENDKIKVYCFEEECFLCPDQLKCSMSGMTLQQKLAIINNDTAQD